MIQTTRINDNISLHYIPMEKLKTTTFGLYIHRALSRDEAAVNSLLAYVLKRGCRLCRDSGSIAKYLQNLYGADFGASVQKKGNSQILSFCAESISDKYAPENECLSDALISLLLSVVFEPNIENGSFNAEIVEQEKANLKNKINSLINDKRSYAVFRCLEEMCHDEPVGIYRFGSADKVDAITPKALYEHYKRIITASVIDIYVCGDADIKAIENKLSDYIKNLSFTPSSIPQNTVKPQSGEIKYIKDCLDVTQGKLALGFRTNTAASDPDYHTMLVLNSVFGAGAHSKLFNNVREKLSLAYYAASTLYKQNGLIIADAGIEFKNYQKAYDESLAQLESIKNGNISDTELDSSIKSIVNSFNSYYDNQAYMTDWYLSQRAQGSEYSIADMIEKIQSVTVADIKAAAQKITLDTVYFLSGKEEA